MPKTIAAILCAVCLVVAARDARAQAGAYPGGMPGGYGQPPGGYGSGPNPYGQAPGMYGSSGAGAGYGAQPPVRPQSGVMGILQSPATPHAMSTASEMGMPTVPGVPVTTCLNRNPPEGAVITKSVRRATCGDKCESEIQLPAGKRMLICRGQAIPEGYTLEMLTSTPDCSCYGPDQNAYMIKAESANDEFRQALPQ